jgi:lysophospholipase L1-like esterase
MVVFIYKPGLRAYLLMRLLILAMSCVCHAAMAYAETFSGDIVDIPSVPEGQNSATFPMAKWDWFLHVRQNNEVARRQAEDIQIIFDGDSITEAWNSRGLKVWQEHYAPLHAFNFALPGDRTEQVLWRLDHGQVDGISPRLVVLLIGTNNFWRNTDEEIAEGVEAVVAEYRRRCPDAVILLQAILPRGKGPDYGLMPHIEKVNERLARLDDSEHIIFLDFGSRFLLSTGSVDPALMPDYLHPSPQGYDIWAEALTPFISRYFPQQ